MLVWWQAANSHYNSKVAVLIAACKRENELTVAHLTYDSIKELVAKAKGRIIPSDSAEFSISKLSYDSRHVEQGAAFFCMPGEKTDGNRFAADAIKSGASCIVTETAHESIAHPQIIVPDVRQTLADFADHLYGQPSRKLRLIGVTGTNGKTTTTHLVENILNRSGKKVGLIGTLGSRIAGNADYHDAKHTTPQAPELQQMLNTMLEHGCTHVSLEVSSHSLALKRVAGCHFALAAYTNLTQDHLDFHKTMENYWKAKRLLFETLNESYQNSKCAVINIDDPYSTHFLDACGSSVKTITYGFSEKADVHPRELTYTQGRSLLKLATPCGDIYISTRLMGQFNAYNVMAATAICLEEGASAENIIEALKDFEGVPGRFETVSIGHEREPLCIVDYAHSPDGLENVLKTAAAMKRPAGKLICVFGCGGDRDPSKRPRMGEIAEARADHVIVTSDNPRTEDPQEIIAQILSGIRRMKTIEVEPDRAAAIKLAVQEAGPDDIVLVAGKGHENYQLVMNQSYSFDDKIEVKKALEASLRTGAASS